jgi:hypothetical protein
MEKIRKRSIQCIKGFEVLGLSCEANTRSWVNWISAFKAGSCTNKGQVVQGYGKHVGAKNTEHLCFIWLLMFILLPFSCDPFSYFSICKRWPTLAVTTAATPTVVQRTPKIWPLLTLASSASPRRTISLPRVRNIAPLKMTSAEEPVLVS